MPTPTSPHSPYPSRRPDLHARNVVATSQPLAAQAGLEVLREGGNAVDAAIATAITLTVVEPTMNGLGSDAFAVVSDGSGVHGFNGSGRSPAAWSPDRFAGRETMPANGVDSITIPGAVDTWVRLSQRFGKLPFPRLFQSGIHYAREGYPVSPIVAGNWKMASGLFKDRKAFCETFLPGGRAPRPGEIFRSAAIAETLTEIADTGSQSFYRGSLAAKIVREIERLDGALSRDDLASHEGFFTDCIQQPFAGTEVHELPPNGQGIAALIALGILDHLDLASHPPNSAESIQLQIEAMKIAFAETRKHVADPAAMSVRHERMLEADFLRHRASEIRIDRAAFPTARIEPDHGTVYLTTADASGMMVSFIQSNFFGFGSGVVIPETGISLQNRGSGFILDEGHPNRVAGGKRPYHTIVPAFVTRDDQPLLSFGVMGGHHQPQGHVQVLVRMLLQGCSPQEALDAPRWHLTEDFSIQLEAGLSHLADALSERGQRVLALAHPWVFGGGQAILREANGYRAGSDPRKDGQAVGF